VELTSGKTQLTLKQGQIAAFWDGTMPLTVSSISNTVVYIATSGIHTS
jgi:hypothetical protein